MRLSHTLPLDFGNSKTNTRCRYFALSSPCTLSGQRRKVRRKMSPFSAAVKSPAAKVPSMRSLLFSFLELLFWYSGPTIASEAM